MEEVNFVQITNTSALPKLRTGLIFLFLSCYQALFSQHRERIDSLLRQADELQYVDFGKSDSLYDEAGRELIQKGIEKDPVGWISVLHKRANSALFHSKLAKAKQFSADAYLAIDNYRQILGTKTDSLKAETQQIEAVYFFVVGNYASALVNLNEAEISLSNREQTPLVCQTLYRVLQFQAAINQLQGEFESCIDRHMASLQYYDCYRDKNKFPNYILINRNIALAYSRLGNITKASHHFFLARANLNAFPKNARDLEIENHAFVLYNSLGEFYRSQNLIDSAKYFLNQALALTSQNQNFLSRINESLAKVAVAEKDYVTAEYFFTKSLEQTLKSRGNKHHLTSNLYRSLSVLYQEKQDIQKSLKSIQQALNSLSSSDIDPENFNLNPPIAALSAQKQTLITLHQKTATLTAFHEKNQSPDFLEAARATNQLAIEFLKTTRNEFSLDKDKVVLGEEAVKVYLMGFYLASTLYKQSGDVNYLSECFELMDESRSAVLMDHIKLVKTFSDLPAELQNRERELKVELSLAEQQLYSAQLKKAVSSSESERVGEIRNDYKQLLNDIKRSAPNYYKFRIENKTVTLAETQKMLTTGEVLVEYFLGDSILHMIVVTPLRSMLFETPLDSIREKVESVRRWLDKPSVFKEPNSHSQLNHELKYLFEKIIAPWASTLESTNRLIVVPNDVLNYLPFEMLPVNASGDVLLNSVAISYASSVSLLREQRKMKAAGNFFAGFNADYSRDETLPQLLGATNEVNSIKDILGFRSSIFSAATADDFRREAPRYKVIHLALHSVVNDEKPMFSKLIFTQTHGHPNADITANELYSMELNAEIAVLSACETGLGKLHRGEGMMSLSRAFMYAGVPSTVISLWKVPDQSASILMTKFYQFLKNGERKDEAMRLAKLEFIKGHPEMSHPFFWAGFIVNGKTDPISFPYFSNQELLIAAIAGLLVLASVLVVSKIRRKATALSA